MTIVPKYTFAGGELAPGLRGRVDLNKYSTGVKTATNCIVEVEGGLSKRFGFYFVSKPKFQDKDCKLVPWRIADDDSYMMEFGEEYIRLIRLGGYVTFPDPFVPDPDSTAIEVDGVLEIPTPYLAVHANELKFSFANDIVYITHVAYAPRQLRRIGLYDWVLELTDFNPHGAAPTGLTAVWERISAGVWQTALMDEDNYAEVPDDIHYRISATMENGLETLPSDIVTVSADLGNSAFRVKLTWDALAGAEQYTIYKGKSGIFGFVGYVQADETLEFLDKNFAPSYDVVPVKNFEGFGTDEFPNEYPRVSEFYKQRRAYAATLHQTQTLWFSRPLFFSSMTTSIPSQDDDAIKVPLVGNARHTIHHMLQLKKFVVFTDSGEWVIHTTNNDALSASSIDPIIETAYGSNPNLQPLAIGDRILFVQNISGTIRDMGYEFSTDAYKADDLSRLARHLFKNKDVISWDYSAFPSNLVLTVCDDGTLPVMTYVREHEIWGWTHWNTDGKFLDAACVPEVNQHATYIQTLRTIAGVPTRFIERQEVSFDARIEEQFFVDCGLTYTDPRSYTGLVRLTGTTFTISAAIASAEVGDELQIENDDFRYRCTVTANDGATISLETNLDRQLPAVLTTTTGEALVCGSHFTGFDHLAGTTDNVVLADGAVFHNIAIALDGSFDLPLQAARVHCGRPYEAEIVTLDLDAEQAAGRYIERTIDEVTLHLENSRGVLVGASASPREELSIPSRDVEDYDQPNAPLDGVYRIPTHTAWTQTAGVRVLAPDPLPCKVLNIVPNIIYGN